MSTPQVIEFALSGKVAGKSISAREGVPFSRFAEYNDDVEKYVQGSDGKAVLNDLQVQIEEGSYLLRVLIPVGLLSSLIIDSAKIVDPASIGDIDPARAKIVLKWQERAQMEPSLNFVVRSPSGAFRTVTISRESNYRKEEKSVWVQVERYLIGEIIDWGGAQNPNVHLRLRNTKDTVIIDATEDQIRGQRENLVFHKALIHVAAKQNPKTGELKDYRLIDLRAYGPKADDAGLQTLFDKGAKAWSDVSSSGAWVEELRGGNYG
ncbi:MAG: hypothetical protein WC378_08205 [Opitutaceae bacterium]|jgi:hypothetical protein